VNRSAYRDLYFLRTKAVAFKRMPESDLMHDYGSNWPAAVDAAMIAVRKQKSIRFLLPLNLHRGGS
jgi:hypothetical protein